MLKAILLLAGLLSACASPDLPEIRRPIRLTDRHSMLVSSFLATGSASPITPNVYLTAAHVVENVQPQQVRVDGQTVQAIILLDGLDAALLVMATDHGHGAWPVDVRQLRPAEPVSVAGYGAGLFWWSQGLATDDPSRISVPVAPGDSGCPVLDADGDIVGIVVARGVLANHHTWIVPITAIVAALPAFVLADLEAPWTPAVHVR